MAVSPQLPFSPKGNTVRIAAVTPTPPTAVQLPLFARGGSNDEIQALQVRIRVSTLVSGEVTIGYGETATLAAANAVLPLAAGASSKSITMASGQCEVFTFPINSFFSALSTTGTINIDLTPGDGP